MLILCVVFTCTLSTATIKRGVDASKADHYESKTDIAKSLTITMQLCRYVNLLTKCKIIAW